MYMILPLRSMQAEAQVGSNREQKKNLRGAWEQQKKRRKKIKKDKV